MEELRKKELETRAINFLHEHIEDYKKGKLDTYLNIYETSNGLENFLDEEYGQNLGEYLEGQYEREIVKFIRETDLYKKGMLDGYMKFYGKHGVSLFIYDECECGLEKYYEEHILPKKINKQKK